MLGSFNQGKLVRTIDLEVVGIEIRFDGCCWRSFGFGVGLILSAARKQDHERKTQSDFCEKQRPACRPAKRKYGRRHGITSRPTARLSWFADIKYEPTKFA